MLRLALIGDGRIARSLLSALADRSVEVVARLTRTPGRPGTTTEIADVIAARPDLVIEVAGPAALSRHGARLLGLAEVWTVSAAALAEPDVAAALREAERTHGRRLVVLPGAIGGLDAVASLARAGAGRLEVTVSRPGLLAAPGRLELALADAVRDHRNELNVAVAAALAGPGIAATDVVLIDPGAGGPHRIALSIEAPIGRFEAAFDIAPLSDERLHPVAASIVAALDRRITRRLRP